MSKRSRPKKSESFVLPECVRLFDEPDRIRIVYSGKRRLNGFRFGLFWALWTGFLAVAVSDMFSKGISVFLLVALSPFFLADLFLLAMTLRSFFHRETLTLDENGLDWRLAALVPVLHRRVPWEQKITIRKGKFYGLNRVIGSWGAEVETSGAKPFGILLDLSPSEEGNRVRELLRKKIEEYRNKNHFPASSDLSGTFFQQRGCYELRSTPESLEIHRLPHGSAEERIFFKIWFIFWSAAIVFITLGVVHSFFRCQNPQRLLTDINALGTAFFLTIFFSLFYLLWLTVGLGLTGRHQRWETLRIDASGISYRERVWMPFLLINITLRKRHIPLNELGLASRYSERNDSGIEWTSSRRPLRCFPKLAYMSDPTILMEPINARLTELGVTEKGQPSREDESTETVSNGRWTFQDDGRSATFSRCGTASWKLIGSVLFVFCFWNGATFILLTGCLVLLFRSKIWLLGIPMALFFSPFLFYGTIYTLLTAMLFLQMVCRYTITIDGDGVRSRRSWLGIGRTRFWPREQIGHVAPLKRVSHDGVLRWFDMIRNPEAYEPNDNVGYPNATYPFEVSILKTAHAQSESEAEKSLPQLGSIPDLLESEARWITSIIRQRKTSSLPPKTSAGKLTEAD